MFAYCIIDLALASPLHGQIMVMKTTLPHCCSSLGPREMMSCLRDIRWAPVGLYLEIKISLSRGSDGTIQVRYQNTLFSVPRTLQTCDTKVIGKPSETLGNDKTILEIVTPKGFMRVR